MRCSEFVTATAIKTKGGHTPPMHIVASRSKGAAWTECALIVDSFKHALVADVPWVECACRSCRESFLVAKKRRKAGWWGRGL